MRLLPRKLTIELGTLKCRGLVLNVVGLTPRLIRVSVRLLMIPDDGAIPMTPLSTVPVVAHTLLIVLNCLFRLSVTVRRCRPDSRLLGTLRVHI